MPETWYVLEDGSFADPAEVAPDDAGVLRHRDGAAVAFGDHGNPLTRSVDADAERGKKPAKETETNKEVEADKPKRTYKTRQVKAKD